MCGIAGAVAVEADAVVDVAAVSSMAAALDHRGPDGRGAFSWPALAPRVAFGMRRLAILDLESGQQPIFNEDGRIAVVCNGEIYNYVELTDELTRRGHVFRSRGDTEVLVHLYEERGLSMFDALRGMYACALWDSARERLVLAVDHLAIKPLYVGTGGRCLRFASELRALFPDRRVDRRLRPEVVETFLTFGYGIGPDTLIEGVERLAPGSALVVERGGISRHRIWRPAFTRGDAAPPPDSAALVRERLGDAVRLHLRSDVPVGVFLSGGVDSAGLLALARRQIGAVRTFTVGYESLGRPVADETSQAAEVARWAGSIHTTIHLTADQWWDMLLTGSAALDDPIANPSMVSLEALARVAARDVRVVLNGTGGDELFGGYAAHRQMPRILARGTRLAGWLPPPARAAAARALGAGERWYPRLRRWPLLARLPQHVSHARATFLPPAGGLRRVASFEALTLTDTLRHRLYEPELADAWRHRQHAACAYRALYDECLEHAPNRRDLAQALVMATWLPGNGLLALDKATMAHGLEARVPYFDRRLIDDVLRIETAIRLKPGKALLAEALAGDLPAHVLTRAKQPFETPLHRWLDRDLASRVGDVLLDPGARSRVWVRRAEVERLLRGQGARRVEHSELIFRLLVLELWCRRMAES
jgi:asparagine synthase (glutamine-hydrolysing)